MNRRLFTIINAIIALVIVGAVIFDVTRGRTARSGHERRQTASQSKSANNRDQTEEQAGKHRIETVDDLANAPVDGLGAVPAAELTELMGRATPEQLAAMALKFNDAPTDARTFGGMGVFFQAWAELDPKAALTGAFQVNDVAMRRLAARTVIGSVSPSAAPELIGFLREHPDKDLNKECNNEFLGRLISGWSLLDPEASSKFIDDLGDTKNRVTNEAREEIAYNWATLDPAAALEWVKQQEGNNFVYTPSVYDNAIQGWCRKDISAASAYVAQHLDELNASNSASSVVTAMFDHKNIDEATAWTNHLPDGDPRTSAESKIARLWAAKEPSAAAKWVATLPPKEQTSLASTITSYWMESNWPEASRWIGTLTGDTRDEALGAAVYREGATREDSLSLALSIGNEETRNTTVENVIRNWAATDPNAAEAWIKGSPLSSEQQEHFRSVISQTDQNAEVERVIISH